jgi:hypothetical protein
LVSPFSSRCSHVLLTPRLNLARERLVAYRETQYVTHKELKKDQNQREHRICMTVICAVGKQALTISNRNYVFLHLFLHLLISVLFISFYLHFLLINFYVSPFLRLCFYSSSAPSFISMCLRLDRKTCQKYCTSANLLN